MTDWRRSGSLDRLVWAGLPSWLAEPTAGVPDLRADDLTRFVPPHGEGRHSAVLLLFGDTPDLLLIRRSFQLRSHAGQPAFPGGAVDPGDDGPVAAALREAQEETGLDPAGVRVFGRLPDLWVPVTGWVVSPVLAYWQEPSPVRAADPEEVHSVHRVPIAALADPANRCRVQHPSGFVGPAFQVSGMTVWGFTAGVISGVLDRFGWARPWDESLVIPLPDEAEDAP